MANIYRIGNLTWRTYDGKFQINAHTIDFTQVDACAEAFVILCFHKKTIKTLSRKYAFRVKEVSQCDFERKLKACKNDRDVAVLGYY